MLSHSLAEDYSVDNNDRCDLNIFLPVHQFTTVKKVPQFPEAILILRFSLD